MSRLAIGLVLVAALLANAAPTSAGETALISAAADGAGNVTLTIAGTDGNDAIRGALAGAKLRFTIDGGAADPDRSAISLAGCSAAHGDYTDCKRVAAVAVDGQAGDDRIMMGDLDVPLALRGGLGDDTLVGGSANDTFDAGEGADSLTGGAGNDTLGAGPGNDVLRAQDGAADALGCGAGNDTAHADAVDALTDCENPPGPAATPDPDDMDGDGDYKTGGDCDDDDPTINHAAHDIAGDGIDQNCDGHDVKLLQTGAIGVLGFKIRHHVTRVRKVRVDRVIATSTVAVRCSGTGCPGPVAPQHFRRNGSAIFTKAFAGRVLAPGAVIAVRISAPDAIATLERYTVRANRPPRRRISCFDPLGAPVDCAGDLGEGDR